LPSILLAVADVRAFAFGGTSILIAVGVALETMTADATAQLYDAELRGAYLQ
jgi:preprotein translocase subunit SecY